MEHYEENCECGNPGTRTIDPYIQELAGAEVVVVLCRDCYTQRLDDI